MRTAVVYGRASLNFSGHRQTAIADMIARVVAMYSREPSFPA